MKLTIAPGDITATRADAIVNAANHTPLGGGGVDGAIHTVGPVWAKTKDKSHQLASCYRESLRVARELGARTVAFPAISAGIYGWPMDDAARIAVETCAAMRTEVGDAVDEVLFVPYGDAAERTFRAALEEVERESLKFGNGRPGPGVQ